MDPQKRQSLINEQEAVRERSEWPVKKIIKEKVNQRTVSYKLFVFDSFICPYIYSSI